MERVYGGSSAASPRESSGEPWWGSLLEPPYNLAGIPRVAFLSKLADYGVDTFDMTEDELRRRRGLPERIC